MERVDIVLLGAEAVVESGAVVSAMGSYGIAIAAHVHKIPFYIICESFKASFVLHIRSFRHFHLKIIVFVIFENVQTKKSSFEVIQ